MCVLKMLTTYSPTIIIIVSDYTHYIPNNSFIMFMFLCTNRTGQMKFTRFWI